MSDKYTCPASCHKSHLTEHACIINQTSCAINPSAAVIRDCKLCCALPAAECAAAEWLGCSGSAFETTLKRN